MMRQIVINDNVLSCGTMKIGNENNLYTRYASSCKIWTIKSMD